jgi:colanic acid biosynthesis glycosyl transferase WcaI
VRAGGCGVVVAPGEPEALARVIEELAGDPERRARLGAEGRAFVRRHFARGPLLDAFETQLGALAKRGRAGAG